MCESELEGARELVDEFKERLKVPHAHMNERGGNDAMRETQPKRQRGRPRKQV